MKNILPNVVAFGQRVRRIREDAGVALVQLCQDAEIPAPWGSRLETGQQKLNVDSLHDWERILAYVKTLRDYNDALHDPRVVHRLLSVLGRTLTVDEMKQVCPDIAYETLQEQFWRTRPSIMPAPKQPVVMREKEYQWLWDHVISRDDTAPAASAIPPWVDAVVTGAPGMGKSTLAQIFAASQQVMAHFPDGLLYASQQTADVHVWLARWAKQYYLDLPEGAKTVLWRDVLRDQLKGLAILVILDDVRDLLFVESLAVVDRQHSRVVMTTRRSDLTEQMGVAQDQALLLQPMTVEQGVELLRAFGPKGRGQRRMTLPRSRWWTRSAARHRPITSWANTSHKWKRACVPDVGKVF